MFSTVEKENENINWLTKSGSAQVLFSFLEKIERFFSIYIYRLIDFRYLIFVFINIFLK